MISFHVLKVMGDCGYGHRDTFTVITEGDEQFFSAVVHDVCLSPSTLLSHGESDSIPTCAISWFYRTFNFGMTKNEKNRFQSQNWFALLGHVTHCLPGTASLPFRQLPETSTSDRQHVLWLSQLGYPDVTKTGGVYGTVTFCSQLSHGPTAGSGVHRLMYWLVGHSMARGTFDDSRRLRKPKICRFTQWWQW